MPTSRRDPVFLAFGGFLAGYLLLQLAFALRLRIDYFDALETLRNARRLLGPDIGFSTNRMPMLPMLHVPEQLALDFWGAGDVARIVAPHLFHWALSASFLALVYRWYRLTLPPAWAALALALLALDRLTAHYFCFAMTEIPCALFLVAFLFFEAEGRPAWAALALGACVCTRSNLLIAPVVYCAFVAARFLVERKKKRGGGAPLRAAAVAASAGALFIFMSALVYHRIFSMSPARAIAFLFTTLRSHLEHNHSPEPFWNYARILLAAGGPAAALLFLLGAGRLVARRKLGGALPLALFAALFLAMSAIGHKEARYLYPVVPILYLVAAGELRELSSRFPAAARAAVAVALLSSAAGAAREAYNMADPTYGNEVMVRLPDLVRGLRRPGGKVFWEGNYYWAVPARRQLTSADPGVYVYHVPSASALAYFLGEPVFRPGLTPAAAGDVLIKAPESSNRMPAADRLELLVYGRDLALASAALLPPGP